MWRRFYLVVYSRCSGLPFFTYTADTAAYVSRKKNVRGLRITPTSVLGNGICYRTIGLINTGCFIIYDMLRHTNTDIVLNAGIV